MWTSSKTDSLKISVHEERHQLQHRYSRHTKQLYGRSCRFSLPRQLPFPRTRDSAVRVGTRYGLGGPGIESQNGRDFLHQSKPALDPIQPQYNGHWVITGAEAAGV